MKCIAGIDIGGTKISMVLCTPRGKIMARSVVPTQVRSQMPDSIKTITRILKSLLREECVKPSELLGIGIGIPGPVDPAKGKVPWSPNLPGWEGLALVKILKKEFSVPVRMDNDANAAAFGEHVFGAGKRARSFVYITVSTGIGGGIVLEGNILRGASFCGGELGHMTVLPGGNGCRCGKHGCLEAHASGTAIASIARQKIEHGASSRLPKMVSGNLNKINAGMVAQAALQKDRLAVEIYSEAGFFLGVGIANVINIINPEMIVLGGSVMKAGALIWSPMIKSVKKEAWPSALKACKIVRTVLGENVGNLGAAALVLEKQ